MRATLTAYYNRTPQELVVDKPAGDWMSFDKFLLALGFKHARRAGLVVPGRFVFLTNSDSEAEKVVGIVKDGGAYLTSGNMDYAFSA